MGTLDGRIAIITGAGRGIGREHALLFAQEGAKVVVNDVGGSTSGEGADIGPAQEVVNEITAMGGEAVANTDSVADWEGSQRLVQTAVDTFGDLHCVVNNAGILRDRVLINMTEAEWDAVIAVHLKGHFCVARHAAAYWREQTKQGKEADRSIVNTSSGSGLMGNAGQTNYGAAKAGIATMTIVWAMELARYGVKSNCIAPMARTRMTLQTPGMEDMVKAPEEGEFDFWDPANISPLVAYLSTADCPFNGGVFGIGGSQVALAVNWTVSDVLVGDGRWTVEGLIEKAPKLLEGRPADVASRGAAIREFNPAGFK
jgi:NAD(P)-dependent dehydrogenase (short-subunit alcohol dehydrogenase family)